MVGQSYLADFQLGRLMAVTKAVWAAEKTDGLSICILHYHIIVWGENGRPYTEEMHMEGNSSLNLQHPEEMQACDRTLNILITLKKFLIATFPF